MNKQFFTRSGKSVQTQINMMDAVFGPIKGLGTLSCNNETVLSVSWYVSDPPTITFSKTVTDLSLADLADIAAYMSQFAYEVEVVDKRIKRNG